MDKMGENELFGIIGKYRAIFSGGSKFGLGFFVRGRENLTSGREKLRFYPYFSVEFDADDRIYTVILDHFVRLFL